MRRNVFGVRSTRLFLLISLLCALGVSVVYWFARDTRLGVRIDTSAIIHGLTPERAPRLHHATSEVLHTIDVTSIVLIGGALVLLALLRRRPDAALGVAVVIAGANLTTQKLKPALGRADFFSGSSSLGASYPSGHATVAMSLALAAVLAAPRGLRLLTAAAGGVYASAVGVALVALGWHYPSDVAGGYLVSGAWTGLVAAALALVDARRTRGAAFAGPRRGLVASVIVLLGVGFTIGVAISLSRRPELISYSRLHTLFFVSCGALAVLSLVLATTTAALLELPARRA
jgi:membrane-associated phospholipid phosphatase